MRCVHKYTWLLLTVTRFYCHVVVKNDVQFQLVMTTIIRSNYVDQPVNLDVKDWYWLWLCATVRILISRSTGWIVFLCTCAHTRTHRLEIIIDRDVKRTLKQFRWLKTSDRYRSICVHFMCNIFKKKTSWEKKKKNSTHTMSTSTVAVYAMRIVHTWWCWSSLANVRITCASIDIKILIVYEL